MDKNKPEPQDRIDFIFYMSPYLRPIKSYKYAGNESQIHEYNVKKNEWPSDHYSLVTEFEIIGFLNYEYPPIIGGVRVFGTYSASGGIQHP